MLNLHFRTPTFYFYIPFLTHLLYTTKKLLCEISGEALLTGLFCPWMQLVYTADNLLSRSNQ